MPGEAFLFREIGSGTRSLFDDFIGDIRIKAVQMGMELGSNETIKQAVMAGIGIALISAHTIAAEVASGRLVRLDVEGLPIVRHWYVVNRTDRTLSPAARAFREFAVGQGSKYLPRVAGLDPPASFEPIATRTRDGGRVPIRRRVARKLMCLAMFLAQCAGAGDCERAASYRLDGLLSNDVTKDKRLRITDCEGKGAGELPAVRPLRRRPELGR